MNDEDLILALLGQAKLIAQKYYALTDKPLGITGEVAEYEAARILGIKLTPARQAGYDAVEMVEGKERTLQIKGRCLPNGCTPGQRLGSIQPGKAWDAVLMVLLDSAFNATEIWEADRIACAEVPDMFAGSNGHLRTPRHCRGAWYSLCNGDICEIQLRCVIERAPSAAEYELVSSTHCRSLYLA